MHIERTPERRNAFQVLFWGVFCATIEIEAKGRRQGKAREHRVPVQGSGGIEPGAENEEERYEISHEQGPHGLEQLRLL